jgi:hypothetical protein
VNSNGKIDKKALEALHVKVEVDALEKTVEAKLATVWADVLGVDVAGIGRHTSFFALGGDSISVVKAVAACKKAGLFLTAAEFLKGLVLWRVAAAAMRTETVEISHPTVTLLPAVQDDIANAWAHLVGSTDIDRLCCVSRDPSTSRNDLRNSQPQKRLRRSNAYALVVLGVSAR